jgi:hypothetical protein
MKTLMVTKLAQIHIERSADVGSERRPPPKRHKTLLQNVTLRPRAHAERQMRREGMASVSILRVLATFLYGPKTDGIARLT